MIAIAAVGSVASVTSGAAPKMWSPGVCPADQDRGAAARAAGPVTPRDQAGEAWFRLDPRLDRGGTLVGQRLLVGLDGDRASRIMDLPPESFAAGPFGRIVLVGADDGTTSRLRAIDVAGTCAWELATEDAVIRRATIDPAGSTVYEMRVDRASRADLGVWARPLDGSASATRVLEPIDPDERFGRTFSTEFAWDLARSQMAVQSCGEVACRTRVLRAGGGPAIVADPELGVIVGLDGDRLVTYAACPGHPCPVVATDLTSGARTVLTDAAAIAVVAATPGGPHLIYEVFDGPAIALRSVALDGTSARDLGPLPMGMRLHASPEIAGAATRVGSGWVLLSPDGRLPDTGPVARTQLRHVTDGTTVTLDEVAR